MTYLLCLSAGLYTGWYVLGPAVAIVMDSGQDADELGCWLCVYAFSSAFAVVGLLS